MSITSPTRLAPVRRLGLALAIAAPALVGAVGPKEAADHYRAERFREAVVEYRRVIAGGDRSEETLYNLGTALLAADSLASAIEVFERVAQSRNEEVKYRAGFNLGLAHLRQGLAAEGDAGVKALDAALAAYKDVLLMRSDDADAKWNYELALRKKQNSGGGGGGGGQDDPAPSNAPDPSATPEAPAPQPQGSLGQGQAEQILNAAERDEREVQEKRRERAQPPKSRTGKDW